MSGSEGLYLFPPLPLFLRVSKALGFAFPMTVIPRDDGDPDPC
jgi:hypothetical protein